MKSLENRLYSKIQGNGRGWVFTPKKFVSVDEPRKIGVALSSLVKKGKIRRIARGLYDYPKLHPKLGHLSPSVDKIATALKERDSITIQPSGAHAAYLIGITEQVPMKTVFLTNGPKRRVKVENREIILNPTTPKNMATAGRISGTIYQGLKWIGKQYIDENTIETIQRNLSDDEKAQLLKDIKHVPAWVAEIFRMISKVHATSTMSKFFELTIDDRRIYFEEAESLSGLPAASIEKDLWVCWTLFQIFKLPDIGNFFSFKGGTSLSKGWKLIKRFSEDIDLIVDKGPLGYDGDKSPENAPSNKQKTKRLKGLKLACEKYVHDEIAPKLYSKIVEKIGSETEGGWRLLKDDSDTQTLLFNYPSVFPKTSNSYLRHEVKIEMGARSDNWPAVSKEITTYLAESFPEEFSDSIFDVQILQPERTFWEKATLLHEENQRPVEKQRKARMSRHYYDLWAMLKGGVGAKAINDLNLFERVVEHRKFFFSYSWVDYSTMCQGCLKVSPGESTYKDWLGDYNAMKTVMFFEEAPEFSEIIKEIKIFEEEFNRGGK